MALEYTIRASDIGLYSVKDQMPGVGREVYGFSGSDGVDKFTFGIPDYSGCDTDYNSYSYEFWKHEWFGDDLSNKQVTIIGDITHWCYVDDFIEEVVE